MQTFAPLISFGQAVLSFGSCLSTGQLIKNSLSTVFTQYKLNSICKVLLMGPSSFSCTVWNRKALTFKELWLLLLWFVCMAFGRVANPPFRHSFGLISLLLARHWWARWLMCYLMSCCLFVLKSPCNNVQNPSNNSWFCKPWLEFVPRVFSRVTLRSFYVVYILQHIVWAD